MAKQTMERKGRKMRKNAEIVLPVEVRHFHKKNKKLKRNGRLLATITSADLGNDRFAVGIARCNKKDRPSRKFGRELASKRLMIGLGLLESSKTGETRGVLTSSKLFAVMTGDQLREMVKTNPFQTWHCPYGFNPIASAPKEDMVKPFPHAGVTTMTYDKPVSKPKKTKKTKSKKKKKD
jgi:hypothetical protein